MRRQLGDIDELAASIRANGVLQPLIVEDRVSHYEIVSGHRRYAAARAAGLARIPCIIRTVTEAGITTARRIVENVHRSDLDPIDEARAYQALIDLGWTRQRICAETGQKLARVSSRLDLLTLPQPAQTMVRDKRLPLGQAQELARQVKATKRGAVGTQADRCPPHFTDAHRLASIASTRCDLAGHPTAGRLGTGHRRACGACWEAAIRLDADNPTPGLPTPRPAPDTRSLDPQ